MVAYMSESQPCRRWHAKEAFEVAWAVSLNLTKLAVLNWLVLEAAKFGCGAPPADESSHRQDSAAPLVSSAERSHLARDLAGDTHAFDAGGRR
jgi:hypothetical protein